FVSHCGAAACRDFLVGTLSVFQGGDRGRRRDLPIHKGTLSRVHKVDNDLQPADSMPACEPQIFVKVILPATLPFVVARASTFNRARHCRRRDRNFSRLRPASGAWSSVMRIYFRTAEMFVPIVVLVVIGVTLTAAAAKFLETTLAPCKESEQDQGL